MRVVLGILSICSVLLGGCIFEERPAGVIASVNGKPITLKTLEAFQEADMSGVGIFEQSSLYQLRQQYGSTLGNLLVFELIFQDLETRGFGITEAQVKAYEADIRSDYPEGEFEKYFEENALDLEAWREVLRYNLAAKVFTEDVLRKNYVPDLAEVEKYYDSHKELFVLEESYDLYAASAMDKKILLDVKSTEDMLSRIEELDPTEMSLPRSEVPENWQKMVYALKGNQCTQVFKDDEHFSVFCLKNFWPQRALTPAEAYVYIEEFMADEALAIAFENWLKEAVLAADIQLSRHVVQDVQ